jgi:4-amino-4-deoxy-L-arabinose transferase-like glycosyltransferase
MVSRPEVTMPSQEGSDSAGGSSRIDPARVSLLAILALAVVARLHGVGELDVWIDEANAILTAGVALPLMLDKLQLDSSPPFFYVVLHFWILIFGDGSIALRLLSGLTGVGLVAATYWAGRELISRPVGLWAALFVAASPIQAYYSQQVRMYALLPLLALLSVALLVRYLRDEKRGDYALWLTFTILALYTHNFAIYLLPVHGVLIALSGTLVRSWRHWALAAAVGLLAFAPWIPTLFAQVENRDQYAWFLADWQRLGPTGVVVRTFRSYSPGAEYVKFARLEKFTTWGGWPTLAMAGLAGLGAWSLALRWRERGWVEALWPSLFLLVPIAGALITSSLLTPHYVPGRVDQMMFPAFALLVGFGLGRLRPTPLRLATVAAILVVATWSKLNLYSDDSRGAIAIWRWASPSTGSRGT